MQEPEEKKKNSMKSQGMYIGLGIAIGVAIGAATDNLALWICFGIVIGAALETSLQVKGEKAKNDDSDSE